MERVTHSVKPLRVVHVVGQMDRGGIETWLMHVLRRLDRERVVMDIVVGCNDAGDYDAEARALGARLIVCTGHTRPWSYIPRLWRILRREGPYDVVHSHVGYFSGIVMWTARLAGVPVRITHSHNTRHGPAATSVVRGLYQSACGYLIRRFSTAGLAVSAPAAVPLFGTRWERDRRWRVFYLAIDLAPFARKTDGAKLRRELGLPADAPIVGHVGRFAPEKNHDFLIDIFEKVAQRRPDARLLLIGDGATRDRIAQKAERLGLAGKVIFAGIRRDVADLLSLVDVVVLPSHHEGLALVTLEAQAAGVPQIIAANLAKEACVIDGLISCLSLAEPADRWATAVLDEIDRQTRKNGSTRALQIMRESEFNIDVGMQRLISMYEEMRE